MLLKTAVYHGNSKKWYNTDIEDSSKVTPNEQEAKNMGAYAIPYNIQFQIKYKKMPIQKKAKRAFRKTLQLPLTFLFISCLKKI